MRQHGTISAHLAANSPGHDIEQHRVCRISFPQDDNFILTRIENGISQTGSHSRRGTACRAHGDPEGRNEKTFKVVVVALSGRASIPCLILAVLLGLNSVFAGAALGWSAYDFFRTKTLGTVFAVDPDLTIRKIDPYAHDKIWTLGEGWGLPPLFYHTRVKDKFDRVDFLYPLGYREESPFKSTLSFFPFFDSRWARIPPFDGYSRCLTVYQGRSDLGQDYWGVFPFFGYTYRKFGVDHNFFLLFPLYYETTDDDIRTKRFMWPFVTYANSPGRKSFKVWPLYGTDTIRNEYSSTYALWPLFQKTEKHPGTEQAERYTAFPFPIYSRRENPYYTTTNILWPFISYSYQHSRDHSTYTFMPFFKYGTGGGVEELNLFYVYWYKKDCLKGTVKKSTDPYVQVGDDEIFTERKFLMVSSIQKRFRKGGLVFAKYRLWPFAEYTWDLSKGSHLKFPEVINLKSDWFDLNLGRLLRIVDLRETPFTRELSVMFGLKQQTEFKSVPHIRCPPKPGDDSFTELITGAFANR